LIAARSSPAKPLKNPYTGVEETLDNNILCFELKSGSAFPGLSGILVTA
jgi:hypothetical protein